MFLDRQEKLRRQLGCFDLVQGLCLRVLIHEPLFVRRSAFGPQHTFAFQHHREDLEQTLVLGRALVRRIAHRQKQAFGREFQQAVGIITRLARFVYLQPAADDWPGWLEPGLLCLRHIKTSDGIHTGLLRRSLFRRGKRLGHDPANQKTRYAITVREFTAGYMTTGRDRLQGKLHGRRKAFLFTPASERR